MDVSKAYAMVCFGSGSPITVLKNVCSFFDHITIKNREQLIMIAKPASFVPTKASGNFIYILTPLKNRFKFIDDLSTLEVINLLTVGLTMFDVKEQVPNDLAIENFFLP